MEIINREAAEDRYAPSERVAEYVPPTPNGALVVGPNDQLVISLPGHAEPDVVDGFMELLRDRFGDRVTVVAGAEQMAVVRGAP